jgi:hypothetical protein
MIDITRSLVIAKAIKARKKGCWYNALKAFFAYEDLQSGWYVEGYAIPGHIKTRLPLEHGWIERADGSIIDPTWAMFGDNMAEYFPGVKYTYEDAVRVVDETEGELPTYPS